MMKGPISRARRPLLPSWMTFRVRLVLVFALQVFVIYLLHKSALLRSSSKAMKPNSIRGFDHREKIITRAAIPSSSSDGIFIFSAISRSDTIHVSAWIHQSVRGKLICCFRLENGSVASVRVSTRYRYHHNTSLVGSQVVCSTAGLGVGYNVTLVELWKQRSPSADQPCPSDRNFYISPLQPLRPSSRKYRSTRTDRGDRKHRGVHSHSIKQDLGDQSTNQNQGDLDSNQNNKQVSEELKTRQQLNNNSIEHERVYIYLKPNKIGRTNNKITDYSTDWKRSNSSTENSNNKDNEPFSFADYSKDWKRVNNSTENSNSKDGEPFSFAICAKILYHNVSCDLLIEWMEYNLRMGADKVVVFTYQLHPTAWRILQYYAQEGFADVRQYYFPLSDYPTRQVGAEDVQVWSDEQVVVFDCQERLSNYKYVSILDIDEFIVPSNKDIGFEKLFNSMQTESPLAAVFIFPMREHVLEWGCNFTTCTYDADTLLVQAHRKFQPVDFNRKVLVRVSRVPSGAMWTHDVYSVIPPFTKVDVHNASVSHFRICRAMWMRINECTSAGASDSPILPALFDKQLRKRVSELKRRFIYSNQ